MILYFFSGGVGTVIYMVILYISKASFLSQHWTVIKMTKTNSACVVEMMPLGHWFPQPHKFYGLYNWKCFNIHGQRDCTVKSGLPSTWVQGPKGIYSIKITWDSRLGSLSSPMNQHLIYIVVLCSTFLLEYNGFSSKHSMALVVDNCILHWMVTDREINRVH